MARYAIVQANIVTNIVDWDGIKTFIPSGTLVPTATGNIGDSYNGSTFTPNAVVTPVITMKSKASAAAALANRLPPDVVALVGVVAGFITQCTIVQQAGDPPNNT